MNRIVVIEDDPAILTGLEAMLRSESYDVLTAGNGEDGYRLVRERQPDLVILDLMLPKMNGYEICGQIRRHGLATPVLMLTAQHQETSRVQGFEVGADDYVTKPFSVRELLGRVRAILRRSEGRSDLANQRELDEARQVQQRLLPVVIPQLPGFRIDGKWQPARIAAGDYFDVFKLENDAMAVCIADVCGKGMPAAMMMSNLQAAVKSHASSDTRPRDLCLQLNRLMCRNMAAQGFISFFYAVIESKVKRLTYCNAGHNPPILIGQGPSPSGRGWREAPGEGVSVRRLECGGGVLGVIEHWKYEEREVGLRSGDRLLMYTDGITECRNSAGEEFGEERLIDLVLHFELNDASALAEEALGAARGFSNGNFEDDLTVVSITGGLRRIMRIRIVAIGMLLLLSAALTAAVQNGNDLYQQGLARETAGDIKGAIQIFERIVRDFSSNRTLTARALVQLGRWSDVLGQDQARKYYERVTREFADQKEAAAEARARLDVLTKVASPGASPARRLVVDWPEWNRKMGDTSRNLTRDGRHVVRYNQEQRVFEEIELSTGNVRRLTSEGPNPEEALLTGNGELSTDGRRLAAVFGMLKTPRSTAGQAPEFERIELRVFEVEGRGMGRVLASWAVRGGTSPEIDLVAWSPRNDRIWLTVVPSDQSEQIVSVDMSGNLQVLKTLPWAGSTQSPSLSPDGRFLVYHDSTGRQTPPDVYIIAADGSREHRIEHPADDSRPVFSPDGSGIVFESNRRGFRDLWYQAILDGRPTGQPRLVWHNVGYFGYVHRFTDAGSLFYYFAVNDWGTYTVPLDLNAGSMGEPTRLAPLVNEGNSGPAFSPDGRHLAHFRANASRIVIRELATGSEREIPLGASLQASYAGSNWCPSGNSLIASGYVNGIGPVSYRVNVKEMSVQRVPISATALPSPICVGDGEEIIYVPAPQIQAAPGSMIVRRSMVSGRETTLFTGTVGALALSMDGRRLAIVTTDPSKNLARLVTMPAAGGEVSADVMTSGTIFQAGQTYALMNVTWMPGDRLLVIRTDDVPPFTTDTSPPAWFWEAPLTGAAPRKLGLLPPARLGGRPAGSFTVSPDGKLLAFQLREGLVAQTWAIDNLSQFIKAGGGW